jgi:hypothetical protein
MIADITLLKQKYQWWRYFLDKIISNSNRVNHLKIKYFLIDYSWKLKVQIRCNVLIQTVTGTKSVTVCVFVEPWGTRNCCSVHSACPIVPVMARRSRLVLCFRNIRRMEASPHAWIQGLHLELVHNPYFCVCVCVNGFIEIWSHELFAWAGFEPTILLISASWVARITGVSHQHLAPFCFFLDAIGFANS